jgi:hypothetical protein
VLTPGFPASSLALGFIVAVTTAKVVSFVTGRRVAAPGAAAKSRLGSVGGASGVSAGRVCGIGFPVPSTRFLWLRSAATLRRVIVVVIDAKAGQGVDDNPRRPHTGAAFGATCCGLSEGRGIVETRRLAE